MSDIQRRITMLWDSRGASQVKASIGEMSSGMSQYRRELGATRGEQGLMDKQMRAFGTTLRYALAGGVLFGTVNAIKTLGDFQAKLGEISAIGSQPGFELTGRKLDNLGTKLLKVSTDTAVPISDIQEAVTNLYSTINNLTPDNAVLAITTIAKVARISQADITDTTQALLGLMNAYNKSPKDIPKLGDEFFQVTRFAAGGVNFAQTYAQQLGVIAQSGNLGRFTPEQTMALTIAGSRFGGSAARNLRGQAQLQRTILNPTNKKSEAFYQQAGVGVTQRADMGGYQVLMKLLTYANTLSPNAKSTFLAGAFSRAESRNQAIVYSKLLSPDQIAAGSKNETLAQYLDHVKNSAGEADKAMDRAMDLRRIQQAGNAMSNFSIAFASAFNPLIQPAAGALVSGSSRFQSYAANHHAEVIGATGAVGAALLLARRFGQRAPGLGALGAAGAVSDTLTGGKVRGDSPMNPLYVIVVSQLVGGPKFGRGGPQYPGPIGPQTEKEAQQAARAGRFARFRQNAGSTGIYSAAAITGIIGAYELAKSMDAGRAADYNKYEILNSLTMKKGGIGIPGLWSPVGGGFHGFHLGGHTDAKATPDQRKILARLKAGYINKDSAERMLEKLASNGPRLNGQDALDPNSVKVSGNATVTVNIDSTDAKGNPQRHTAKVPLPLFSGFTPPAPQTAGKNKTKRGN